MVYLNLINNYIGDKMGNKIYYFYVISGAILWGLISLFSNTLSECGLSPKNIVSLRSFGAAIILMGIFAIKDRSLLKIDLKDIKYFIGTGIVSFVFFNWCLFTSINECSGAIAVVLLYTAPIFVTLMSAVLFKEKMNKTKVIALLLTVIGCMCVTGVVGGKINGTLYGILCGIGSGVFYALYSIFGRYALMKYKAVTVTIYTFVFAAIGSIPLISINELKTGLLDTRALIAGVLIVVVSTVSPFLLYTKGLTKVESGTASILATAEPAVGVIVSIFILHQPINLIAIIGVFLILGAVISLNFNKQEN